MREERTAPITAVKPRESPVTVHRSASGGVARHGGRGSENEPLDVGRSEAFLAAETFKGRIELLGA